MPLYDTRNGRDFTQSFVWLVCAMNQKMRTKVVRGAKACGPKQCVHVGMLRREYGNTLFINKK
jgi:hypothetical protein